MKRIMFSLMALVMCMSINAQVIEIYDKENALVGSYNCDEAAMVKLIESPFYLKYVNLGLPSGLKWATCNVYALDNEPTATGDYYAWGETFRYNNSAGDFSDNTENWKNGKENGYSWNTYSRKEKTDQEPNGDFIEWTTAPWEAYAISTYTYYKLKSEFDVASVEDNWKKGNNWRIPTKEDWEELYDNCYWVWTDNYRGETSAKGFIVYHAEWINNGGGRQIDRNPELYTLDKPHIFLPAGGRIEGKALDDDYAKDAACYWSSTLQVGDVDNPHPQAYATKISQSDITVETEPGKNTSTMQATNRYLGLSIRPVCPNLAHGAE